MKPSSLHNLPSVVALVAILLLPGAAYAQASGCAQPSGSSVGVAVGRSSPYLDLARGAVEHDTAESILVRNGSHVGARGDLSLGGPFRLRVEASTARWNVVRQTYSPELNYQLTSKTSVGRMTARSIGAAAGLRGGRAPVCWYVLAGGGLHTLGWREATLHRPGLSFTAGIEVPTGQHGRIQADIQLHVIQTNGGYPVSGSGALEGVIAIGWAYRFD